MKNSPIITVYITNYNYGTYIKKAINSVLEQSYKNIDLIIIDDASSDSSKKIIKKYEKYDHVRIIYNLLFVYYQRQQNTLYKVKVVSTYICIMAYCNGAIRQRSLLL